MGAIDTRLDSLRRRRQASDVLLDEYVRWRQECLMVHQAYNLWTIASTSDRGIAHAAYVAALDREAEAAASYCRAAAG
jgi:hypothetical protein